MADVIREEIRAAIGDDVFDNEQYNDTTLNIFIRAALKRLATRINLDISISNGVLSPVPTPSQSDLISLQAQCLIYNRELRSAPGAGIRVAFDEAMVDTTAKMGALQDAAHGKYSPCALLELAVADYINNNPDLNINSSTSMYAENIWAGTQKLYEDVTYDGQGSDRLWHDGKGRSKGGRRGGGKNYETGGLDGTDRFHGDH